MNSARGNVFDYKATHYLVIPTNIGWKATGENVMGRGLALGAALAYPDFPVWYGRECMIGGANTPVVLYPKAPLIAFPTKPLNTEKMWMSWKGKSDLELIERSAIQLAAMTLDRPVAVPMVGCGNGGLNMADVRPILDKHLSNERFLLVLQ